MTRFFALLHILSILLLCAFLICLLFLSCNSQPLVDSQPAIIISDSSSLNYRGKPLFVFGENIDKMSSRPAFWLGDSTHKDGDGYSYVAIDTFFTVQQTTGSLTGTLVIRTNNLRQIQKVFGIWSFNVQKNDKTLQEAINMMRAKYFPNLSPDFSRTKQDTILHKTYIELFRFSDSTGWRFDYEATPALLKF